MMSAAQATRRCMHVTFGNPALFLHFHLTEEEQERKHHKRHYFLFFFQFFFFKVISRIHKSCSERMNAACQVSEWIVQANVPWLRWLKLMIQCMELKQATGQKSVGLEFHVENALPWVQQDITMLSGACVKDCEKEAESLHVSQATITQALSDKYITVNTKAPPAPLHCLMCLPLRKRRFKLCGLLQYALETATSKKKGYVP